MLCYSWFQLCQGHHASGSVLIVLGDLGVGEMGGRKVLEEGGVGVSCGGIVNWWY
jgi:hypothetical protein